VAPKTRELTGSTSIEQPAVWRRSVPIFGVIRTGDVDAADFCRAYPSRMFGQDAVDYQDVTYSFCWRHNREVRVVAHDRLVICLMGVAKCAKIFDDEVGIPGPPGGWTSRWPSKA
jgi:hypothetical protein